MLPQGVMKSGAPNQPQQVVQNINGMQYVCCVVPTDESGNMMAQLPAGAVTLGPGGSQLTTGAVPLNMSQLPGMSTGMSTGMQQLAGAGIPLAPLGGMGGSFNTMPTGPNSNHNSNNNNNNFFANRGPQNQMGDQVWGRQQAPPGPRPSRGRSPTGGRERRNGGGGGGGGGGGNGQAPGAWPQQGGPQQPQAERDWGALRNSAGSPKTGMGSNGAATLAQLRERRQSAERRNSTERRTSNERRNNFGGADRRTSTERRFFGGADRRTSAERRNFGGATDRRHSAERRRSTERRFSRERRFSQERRAKSMGPSTSYHQRQVQLSGFWLDSLNNNKQVQIWVVADQQALSQAAYRLNFLQPGTVTAFEFHGVNLASGGTLCLASVAFDDVAEPSRNVVIFDVLQLGEQFQVLGEFLANNISKLVYDVDTHAKICAQQFGMNMNRVFHAQSAFNLLRGRNPESMVELLEWCGTSSPKLKQTSVMMDRVPELWTHRPLSKETLKFAVECLSSMLDSGHSLFNRLVEKFGPSAEQKITSASEQRVQEAANRGWELRNAGFTGEPHDPELNNWLARRFGQTHANLRSGDDNTFHDAVRVGDSPRTASWRATVAQMGGASSRGMSRPRQRSSSPSLATWIARRNNLKPDSQKVHRASSLPPNPSGFISDGNNTAHASNPVKGSPQLLASVEPVWDQEHKNWADAADEEQARAQADHDDEQAGEEVFNSLLEVERTRQAEL